MTNEIPQASGPDALSTPAARHWLAKVLIALACGVAVAGVSVCAARLAPGDNFFGGRQAWTRVQLDYRLPFLLREYREKKGEFPACLEHLKAAATAPDGWGTGYFSITDGWGRAFLYERPDPSHFILRSLGRDGAPSGVGLDYDVVATEEGLQWDEELARPTSRQFLFEMPTRGVLLACGASGLLAAGLTLVALRRAKLTADGVVAAAILIALIAAGSVVLAGVMAIHHINLGPFDWGH